MLWCIFMEQVLHIVTSKAIMCSSRGVQKDSASVPNYVTLGVQRRLTNYHVVQQNQSGVGLSDYLGSLAVGGP